MSHALLYIAESVDAARELPSRVRQPGIDVLHIVVDTFKLENAEEIKLQSVMRPFVDTERHYVIAVRSMTVDAQNALLKLFEEPPADTIFHIVVPFEDLIIPTLRSRLIHHTESIEPARSGENKEDTYAAFKALPINEQLSHIEKRNKQKDTAWFNLILNGVEHELGASERLSSEDDKKLLKAVIRARTYVPYPGASKKMLFEDMVLTLHAVTSQNR